MRNSLPKRATEAALYRPRRDLLCRWKPDRQILRFLLDRVHIHHAIGDRIRVTLAHLQVPEDPRVVKTDFPQRTPGMKHRRDHFLPQVENANRVPCKLCASKLKLRSEEHTSEL